MVQLPLVTVHRSVADVPIGIPVTVVVREEGVVIVAVPLCKVQVPAPAVGALAAIVKVDRLWATSGPALAGAKA